MIASPLAQLHPVMTGIGFAMIPFAIAAYIWMRASAKAYSEK